MMAIVEEVFKREFDFVICEIIRFSGMTWEELKPHLKRDGLFHMKDASGNNRTLGRAASTRLYQLICNLLADSAYHRRVDPQRTFNYIKKELGKKYIHGGYKEPTATELMGQFFQWIEQCGEDCAERTHFIPCNIGMPNGRTVQLGSVFLRSRSTAWAIISAGLEDYESAGGSGAVIHRKKNKEIAEKYYSAFPDIAEVRVPSCDAPMSRVAAEAAVQAILDIIHVMGGAAYTARMRGGGPPVDDQRGDIQRDKDGNLTVSWSRRWNSAQLSEQWWDWVDDPSARRLVDAISICVTSITRRRDAEMIADRFLDGCAWYGDASREQSEAAAIVKYLTAMERLLWTGERGPGVTKRLSKRAAALCFETSTWNMDELTDDVAKAYDLRSAIVHGRISKADPKIAEGLRLCERVSRKLLLVWLERFSEGFNQHSSVEILKTYLDGLTRVAEAECKRKRSGQPPGLG